MSSPDNPVVAIVEDEELLADMYATWIDDSYEVRIATSGSSALEVIDADVDVVFLDRRMPDVDGDDVLRQLRERGNTTQVAMLTAVDADFDILDLPLDDYLHKPVSKAAFNETIEQLLRRSHYEQTLQRFHELAAKRAALEAGKDLDVLAESDEYHQLLEELERVRTAADATLEEFDHEDYRGEFKRLATS